MEPRLPVLGDGVLIGRRHWLVSVGSGLMLLYTLLFCGGWGKGLMMRLGLALDTLLGPEGMTVGCFLGRWFCDAAVWWCCGGGGVAWRGLSRIPDAVVPLVWGVGGVAGAGWWLRVGCLLRITQWTRASLWSSCQGRTVDALAPGADEGRGRPR